MKIKDAKWKMLDNSIGMKPKFRVFCTSCFWAYFEKRMIELAALEGCSPVDYGQDYGYLEALDETVGEMLNGRFDMVLREVFSSPLPAVGKTAYHNDMHYKCAKSNGCDAVKVFGVPIDKEYYQVLMQRRLGHQRILPWEDWDKDDDIKQQLKNMGYI